MMGLMHAHRAIGEVPCLEFADAGQLIAAPRKGLRSNTSINTRNKSDKTAKERAYCTAHELYWQALGRATNSQPRVSDPHLAEQRLSSLTWSIHPVTHRESTDFACA
eukprot:353304-Chlamydomonas_euryale.AAC.7